VRILTFSFEEYIGGNGTNETYGANMLMRMMGLMG
jgi:hypothetical protein